MIRRWTHTHAIDRTVSTAPAAAARLYFAGKSKVRTKICVVSVSRPVGWPRASGTPNSPAAETKTMIAPERMPGRASGSVMRRTTWATPQGCANRDQQRVGRGRLHGRRGQERPIFQRPTARLAKDVDAEHADQKD